MSNSAKAKRYFKLIFGLASIWLLLFALSSDSFLDAAGHSIFSAQYPGFPSASLAAADARLAVAIRLKQAHRWGLALRLNETQYTIRGDLIGLSKGLVGPIGFDREKLRDELSLIAFAVEKPVKDLRLEIQGRTVSLLTDIETGLALNQAQAADQIEKKLNGLNLEPLDLDLMPVEPAVSYENAVKAKKRVEQMLSEPIVLKNGDEEIVVDPETIGSWIKSEPAGDRLNVVIDATAVSEFVAGVADQVNDTGSDPEIKIIKGKVVSFVLEKEGRLLEEDILIGSIINVLRQRREGADAARAITLTFRVQSSAGQGQTPSVLGIEERIGSASTSFKGSPANRKANIKNGVKFLKGILLEPGQEFSTVKALGRISGASGYLPELVIKGNRTVPEYGGGLCQVSTTLFRAVMSAGLPVTSRRNHSYSVSYYENDGDGNYIGPGLDATIYSPTPDFRFLNDMDSAILVWGYVKGDKVTFELYGKKDGRTAEVIGPVSLVETPPGKAIYVKTDSLPKGVIKQMEKPHAGAATEALYIIRYPDGRVADSLFAGLYRAWPARYLIGTGPVVVSSASLKDSRRP